jgi:hypothetical protein
LSSKLYCFSAHSLDQSSHLRRRQSQVGRLADGPRLLRARDLLRIGRSTSGGFRAALTRLGRDRRVFDKSFGYDPRRAEQLFCAPGVDFWKARCGKQQLGLRNEAVKRPQVCSGWHNSKLNRTANLRNAAKRKQLPAILILLGQ